MVTLRVFTTRRLIRCTRFDGSCLRIFAAKCSTEKIGQYGFALGFKLSRERSKKTEAVFLVGSRESEGKSKSPQALFLLPAFSFGEAKENAERQLQVCTAYQPFTRLSTTALIFTLNPLSQSPAVSSPCRKGSQKTALPGVPAGRFGFGLIQKPRSVLCRRRRSGGRGRARRGSRSASSSAGTSCPSPRSRRRSGPGS